MVQVIINGNNIYIKKNYKNENEIVRIFNNNYKNIISQKSFWIPLQKQLKAKRFKNNKSSICDGYLLDWHTPSTPTLYITEFELMEIYNEEQKINKHILPQLGDFITFIQSSNKDELNDVKNYIYQELKNNKEIFQKIQKDTDKEVYELLDNALEDLQILLIIDEIKPDLSIGLSQIERAINVKIRKLEINNFNDQKNNEIIYFTDSGVELEIEKDEKEIKAVNENEDYTIEYHLENKSEKIQDIIKNFIKYYNSKNIKEICTKFYIGFYKNDLMIFSCVVRKNSIVFYSKAKIDEIKKENLPLRDVRNIGHYTNHMPTEIVIIEKEQVEDLYKYFNEVIELFN